jgi:transketolase
MRTAFIKELMDLAEINEKIFLIVADLGYSVVEPFAEKFPERYLNVGISEQNMAGIAAGLAIEGYCVYIYSIGNFPTLRCMEQIRYDICYHNLNVKIVAVGGGYAYASLGPSHHATEELGMLRTIPNLVVCAPADPYEARAITKFAFEHVGPCYIRLGKAGESMVPRTTDFDEGKIQEGAILKIIEHPADIAVFSTGSMLKYTVDFISQNNIRASVYSFPFVKPIDKHSLAELFKRFRSIITIEEHQASCGFGSAILELLNDLLDEGLLQKNDIPHIKRVAIRDKFYSTAGSQDFLRSLAGLELSLDFFDRN